MGFHELSSLTNAALVIAAAIAVWSAGTKLARCADAIAAATGIGRKQVPLRALIRRTVAVGAVILAAGFLLARTAEALAHQTGLVRTCEPDRARIGWNH